MSGAQVLLLMGVAGAGKSTVGEAVAKRLGWQFRDADEFHSQANRDKQAQGIPLDDNDRAPWLAAIAAWIDTQHTMGESAVVTCSALKRRYREVIVGDREFVRLVYLCGDRSLLQQRLDGRKGHFMPTSLLDNQLETLEEPGPDEHAVVLDIGNSVPELVDQIVHGRN